MEVYQSSLNGNDDNFSFNDYYDVKKFSRMLSLLFCFLDVQNKKRLDKDEYPKTM